MTEVKGTMKVEAETNGRKLTLDPIKPTRKVEVEVREVETTIPCGFRQSWLTGEGEDGTKIELLAQAGFGGKWLIFHMEKGDERREFLIDTTELVELLVENARKDEG